MTKFIACLACLCKGWLTVKRRTVECPACKGKGYVIAQWSALDPGC